MCMKPNPPGADPSGLHLRNRKSENSHCCFSFLSFSFCKKHIILSKHQIRSYLLSNTTCLECDGTKQPLIYGLLILFILFKILLKPLIWDRTAPFGLENALAPFIFSSLLRVSESRLDKGWSGDAQRWPTPRSNGWNYEHDELKVIWRSLLSGRWVWSQPCQTHIEVWSLSVSWSWHHHTLQVDFPFQLFWLEALTPGQPYLCSGTAALSTGCQAGSGKTLKSWGPVHLLQFTGMCQQ